MLTQYKNINQIEASKKSISAERFSANELQLLAYPTSTNKYPIIPDITNNSGDTRLELHVYSNQTWITGNHRVQQLTKLPKFVDKQTNKTIRLSNPVAFDIRKEFDNLKLANGNFKIVVNFFKNLIGNYEQQYLVIDEISPDRTEIRLRAIDESNPIYLQQITNYISNVDQLKTINTEIYPVSSAKNQQQTFTTLSSPAIHKTYLLNFSRNQNFEFVNSVSVNGFLYIKLKEALPQEFQTNFKVWIVEELKKPYIDNVTIVVPQTTTKFNSLAGPNWQANQPFNTSAETDLRTWSDLLGSSAQTSQQIVDTYFSGSLSGIKLNIDYSDFNNFIFYSSAAERLVNFKYKLELLEYYTSQSLVVSKISGSIATTNAQDFLQLKNNLIGGFDNFEQYLYYQSSSLVTTYPIPTETPIVSSLTGSYVTPVPKLNSTRPYTLTSVTSSQFINWYDSLYASASLYDANNLNALIYAIPEYIRFNQTNDQLTTFVNMLGHHYDILYTYINHMSQLTKREENPKLGMPNELLYSVAKQFGWTLTDGNQSQELWQYVLGTNESGIPLTGSNTIGDPSVPGREMTYTVWRRIVNNLPLLLKSKGTKRSIQALLSCYGIPQSIISINEYGGPRLERAPIYQKLNFDYALDLSSSSAGTVKVNYSQSINSIEIRFRTADVTTNPTMPGTMNIFNVGSNSVTIDFTRGTLGNIQINGTSSADFELFNGDWVSAILRKRGTNLDLIAKKSKYGKIVTAVSASATGSIPFSGSVTLGSTSVGANRLLGQLQELRLWSSSLEDSAFNNHVKAPSAYDGNVDAYSELKFRLPLTQKINHSTTGSLMGVQPVSSSLSASFNGWTLSTPYDSIEETYYYDAISLGAGTFDDNKIRLESNELVGTLDVKSRAERSQFDKAPLDSKKLGVYFSPQTMINEDIISQFGFVELDQYIGDPGDVNSKSYPDLKNYAQSYWKKYNQRNDINSYISMFTLFDLSFFKQLEQLLPARTDKLTGILVQPNILERSKDTILPKIRRSNDTYNGILANVSPTASGVYTTYNGAVNGKIMSISGADDDQIQGYLTSSVAERYGGTTYSYTYLIRSGSTYITSSSPYWQAAAVQPVYLTNRYSAYRLGENVTFITGSVGASGTGVYGSGVYGVGIYGSGNSLPILGGFSGSRVEFQDYLPRGIKNQRYAGCKLTSPNFNVNSTQTIDGGPVVQWRSANPNQLIYQNNGEQGSFVLV